MRSMKLLAAVMCCVTLLAGCGSNPGEKSGRSENTTSSSAESSYSYSSSSVIPAVESSKQSSSTAETKREESSSSVIFESEDKKALPTPRIYRMYKDGSSIQIQWEMDESNELYDETYKMRVFHSSTPDDYGTHKDYMAFFPIRISEDKMFNGNNYFRIKFFKGDEESEVSEPYCYKSTGGSAAPSTPATSNVHQYTHTFDTPADVTAVPDYSSALMQLQNGEQPLTFFVRFYYTCPLCGRRDEIDTWNFYYSVDSSYAIPFVHCKNGVCPNFKNKKRVKINCYATQIS